MSPLDGFRRLGCSKGERASVMTITARRDGLPVQRPGSSDLNHDGKSTRDELFTLDQVGISSISLAYTIDPYVNAVGGEFRFASTITTVAGTAPRRESSTCSWRQTATRDELKTPESGRRPLDASGRRKELRSSVGSAGGPLFCAKNLARGSAQTRDLDPSIGRPLRRLGGPAPREPRGDSLAIQVAREIRALQNLLDHVFEVARHHADRAVHLLLFLRQLLGHRSDASSRSSRTLQRSARRSQGRGSQGLASRVTRSGAPGSDSDRVSRHFDEHGNAFVIASTTRTAANTWAHATN